MKWNWGTKLTVAIVLFMSLILSFVYRSTLHQVNLVEEDYYPKGLKYQERIDEIKNAKPFFGDAKISQSNDLVVVTFPDIHPDTGTIMFYRPSNQQFDHTYQLIPDSLRQMTFPKSEFRKGKYLIKIFWSENNKGYYIEKPFYFR